MGEEMNYIGLDIGGTKCAAVLGGERGEIRGRLEVESGRGIPPSEILKRLAGCAHRLLRGEKQQETAAVGISCGGPLDSARGLILSPPNLPLWDKIPIVAYFENELRAPAFLENDANACAIAEWRFGAGKGTQNMVFLTFGTGLGAGLILNGALYRGASGLAGEAGHIRLAETGPVGHGKAGSFEGFCSGGGIRNLAEHVAQEKLQRGEPVGFALPPTAKGVCAAAQAGDPAALEVLATSAEYLGRGLAVLVDLLNPECIVIGSVFARAEPLFRKRMQESLAREALELASRCCRVLPAALGDSLGDAAALTVAIEGRRSL